MQLRRMILVGLAMVMITLAFGCGPKAFTKGEYDDPTKVVLLDDRFNESDMQQMADTIVKAMIACEDISKAVKPPVVVVEKVQNRTEEHIDMVAMTDMIRTNLIKSKRVRFVNKTERETVEGEMKYQESGAVSAETQKKRGRQTGAGYVLSGAMATNVQEMGDDKLIYYKLTMNLTNMETTEIDCTEEREIRKKFKRQSMGL